MAKKSQDEYSEKEAAERLAAALHGARSVGHKPQSELRLGKRKPTRPQRKATKKR
jgi:hypothetical protein